MDYITAEQFLEQPREIQKIFEQWEEKNITETDLFGYIGESPIYKKRFPQIARHIAFDCLNGELIPLLSETQLRHFIEEKLDCRIDIECSVNGYNIRQFVEIIGGGHTSIMFEWVKGHDLLQAYWQVACKIAEGD